jgi:hypothetical protein
MSKAEMGSKNAILSTGNLDFKHPEVAIATLFPPGAGKISVKIVAIRVAPQKWCNGKMVAEENSQ